MASTDKSKNTQMLERDQSGVFSQYCDPQVALPRAHYGSVTPKDELLDQNV